jgi:hypothetical protein
MPHDIYPLQGLLAQQVGMVAKIQTAFRHLIGKQFWINILLTLLGYIPGIVHAVWVIAKY